MVVAHIFSKTIVDNTGKIKKFILDDELYNQFINIMNRRYNNFKDLKKKIEEENTDGRDKRQIEDKINSLCKILSDEFHQPNNKNSLNLHDNLKLHDSLKLPDGLKLPNNLPLVKPIDTIGRMTTIQRAAQYDPDVFSALQDNKSTIQWTQDINDAYILCAYMKSRINQDNKVAPNNRKFSLVLIVDKNIPFNNFINPEIINLEATVDVNVRNVSNCEATCIYPPSSNYEHGTYSKCESSGDKKACYLDFPSVTFTEIILLTGYFGMDCYHLDNYNSEGGEKYDLYFFSIKDCENPEKNSMIDVINNFNNNNKLLKLTQVKVLSMSDYRLVDYKSKYLKYKSKYLALKNKMHEKHDTK